MSHSLQSRKSKTSAVSAEDEVGWVYSGLDGTALFFGRVVGQTNQQTNNQKIEKKKKLEKLGGGKKEENKRKEQRKEKG